ncbi:MAG TPA: S8 family serine peptidase [Solirubrobacteraceae bacterium]|nr:S8 family serine peptidase [Solirubrobacteraceae bacterium]
MADKALITRRAKATDVAGRGEAIRAEVESAGFEVLHDVPEGALIRADRRRLRRLEGLGFRVKVLPDTDVLNVGAFRIDVTKAPPKIPTGLRVPADARESWPHHLLQLAGPPTADWVRAIEERGVHVVEPISTYGLFCTAAPDQIEAVRADLPFVEWAGPFEPAYRVHPNLEEQSGRIQYVSVGVFPPEAIPAVADAVGEAGGAVVRSTADEGGTHKYGHLVVELDKRAVPEIARHPDVRWLEFVPPAPGLEGERETQILAGNFDGAALPNTAPVPGYQAWLTGVGLSGAGVTVAICDSGVDAGPNNNASGHVDIAGRQTGFVDYSGGTTTTDTDGHGTHVAGIAVANAASGQVEAAAPNDFLWGQGVAPGANLVTQNATQMSPWPPASYAQMFRDSITNGAAVQNDSWTSNPGQPGLGYTAICQEFDQLVRDPDTNTAQLEELAVVCSAGNSGPNASTITAPKEAKNVIVVGNSLTVRPGTGVAVDEIDGLRATSSRGPAIDGRFLPTVVAPGTNVSSIWSETGSVAQYGNPIAGTGNADPANPGNTINQYMFMGGTSMASPHVAGACALLIEWWGVRTGGRRPSIALLKALLVNGAVDLGGGRRTDALARGTLANIPNNHQGWGRVSLENMLLQAPESDRGPRIFSDQRHAFTTAGQEHTIRVAPADPARPMRVTLVWTDAPGAPNANPALVNDLDLEVTETATGTVFRGNVFGANGFSNAGGAFDTLNNVECVYVQNPNGAYDVTVVAGTIAANARPPFDAATPWQDFALVIENAEVPPAAPVTVVPVIDRSGSMVSYGYVDATRTASKQFVDLMGVDDGLGVVSFGDTGTHEYAPANAVATITGADERTAARDAIDAIGFGGCTYMGDGIAKARDLLAPVAGTRALVLLSDGYDNKGCDEANPAKPSALESAAALPADVPIYSCAMGPSSDQGLLEQLATTTDGRYYYMPTIDDLFEIYNYIRGRVTGDSIIANESSMASTSRVAAFVDALATEATFSVAWPDRGLRYVPREPRKANELAVRLIDPAGRTVNPNASWVRRVVGDGYVVFEIVEPPPGRWHVEVETARGAHTRYTVGGFVTSPIRLALAVRAQRVAVGSPLRFGVRVFDGKEPIGGFRAKSQVIRPPADLRSLLKKHSRVKPKKRLRLGGDSLPRDVARVQAIRNHLLDTQGTDIFAAITEAVRIGAPTGGRGATGTMTQTDVAGSYNVVVRAGGVSPASGTRFERRDMVSVLVT